MSLMAEGYGPGNVFNQQGVEDTVLILFYPLLVALCLYVIVGALRRQSATRTVLLVLMSALCGLVIAGNLSPATHGLQSHDTDPKDLYPAHNLSVPVDHFHNESRYEPHSSETFNLRYFFDAQYYRPGGPVIVLQSGETDATDRLPYLQKGIVAILARATNGIGVVLEHRYYGTSFPTEDLSTENLRFLSTDQAVADQAYFSSHITFPGLEHLDLTAPNTPHIAYGGSYAGGMVAFQRKLYPELTWGAISSSGVTVALYDFWQYYEPIREYAPSDVVETQTELINILDNILDKNDSQQVSELKSLFGLQDLTFSDDFANVVSSSMGYWQSNNWDPEVSSPKFGYYAGNITSDTLLWPGHENLTGSATYLVEAGGWGNESSRLTTRLLNLAGWTEAQSVSSCTSTLDECYGSHNESAAMYADKSVSNYNALSWAYQYCTEWGYIQTGSGVPEDRLPLVSRQLTLEYLTQVCRYAFNISSPPDVEAVNKYGGYNISAERLAIVGGETDPWRPVSPLASLPIRDRLNSTCSSREPLIVIPGAVHHWDENGLFANETTADLPPVGVRDAQAELLEAVQLWLADFAQWNQTRSA